MSASARAMAAAAAIAANGSRTGGRVGGRGVAAAGSAEPEVALGGIENAMGTTATRR